MTETDDLTYAGRRDDSRETSGLISTDPFDVALHDLLGHPNGAHTQATTVRAINNYKHVTDFIIQTVKWDAGTSVFVTQVNAKEPIRLVLPPKVMAAILRQQEQVSAIVRRKQGQRLAEQLRADGKLRVGGFTPGDASEGGGDAAGEGGEACGQESERRGAMSAPVFATRLSPQTVGKLVALLARAVEVLDADGIVYGNCDEEPLDVLREARALLARIEKETR